MKMKTKLMTGALSVMLLSCNTAETETAQTMIPEENAVVENTPEKPEMTFENRGQELVYEMVQKVGDYKMLRDKKDVVYTYSYTTPDGKTDITTEKYIFDGELSYGAYKKHERTLPDLKGNIEQGYDGNEFWIKHDGEVLNDEKLLAQVKFNRPTNFYWFTMMQKLMDPGLNYEHLGEKTINENEYDIVKVSFDSPEDKPTDIYQLFINKETSMVDQFLFTVADFGVVEQPFLMELEYENVDGIMIPTQRNYKQSTWDAELTDGPWIQVSWTNINFNNGLTIANFTK